MMVPQRPTASGVRIRNAHDAHLLFYAVHLDRLPMIHSRLDPTERNDVKAGAVFIWEERSSNAPGNFPAGGTGNVRGIERWTDGLKWGPSRVRDDFLFYQEKDPAERTALSPQSPTTPNAQYRIRPVMPSELLVKQTYSVHYRPQGQEDLEPPRKWHLTAYHSQGTMDKLAEVTTLSEVQNLEVPQGIFTKARVGKKRDSTGPMASPTQGRGGMRHSLPSATPQPYGSPTISSHPYTPTSGAFPSMQPKQEPLDVDIQTPDGNYVRGARRPNVIEGGRYGPTRGVGGSPPQGNTSVPYPTDGRAHSRAVRHHHQGYPHQAAGMGSSMGDASGRSTTGNGWMGEAATSYAGYPANSGMQNGDGNGSRNYKNAQEMARFSPMSTLSGVSVPPSTNQSPVGTTYSSGATANGSYNGGDQRNGYSGYGSTTWNSQAHLSASPGQHSSPTRPTEYSLGPAAWQPASQGNTPPSVNTPGLPPVTPTASSTMGSSSYNTSGYDRREPHSWYTSPHQYNTSPVALSASGAGSMSNEPLTSSLGSHSSYPRLHSPTAPSTYPSFGYSHSTFPPSAGPIQGYSQPPQQYTGTDTKSRGPEDERALMKLSRTSSRTDEGPTSNSGGGMVMGGSSGGDHSMPMGRN